MCDKYFHTEFYTDLPYVPLHRVLHRVIICHLHRVLHRVLHRFEIRPSTQGSTQICFTYFYAEIYTELLYSLRPKLSTKSCFIKQKCQLCIVKYKNVAMPMSTLVIHTTHQHFQMRYITLF